MNNARLHAIRDELGLSGAALERTVSALLGVSTHAVHHWMLPETSAAYRRMPDPLLELLELKLGAMEEMR